AITAMTSAITIPSASGITVSCKCWTIRSQTWPRWPATHPKSKIFVPGGISDPLFDRGPVRLARVHRLLPLRLAATLAAAGPVDRIERRRVLPLAHLRGDRCHREEPLDRAVPVDDDPGLDVGVEHHRQRVLEGRPLVDGRRDRVRHGRGDRAVGRDVAVADPAEWPVALVDHEQVALRIVEGAAADILRAVAGPRRDCRLEGHVGDAEE